MENKKQTPNDPSDNFLSIEDNINKLKKLNNYRFIIEKYATNKVNTSFSNSSKEHAAIVISSIFKYAENTICIFDKNLIKDSFISLDNEMKDNIENFLNKSKARLDIALQDELITNDENSIICSILKKKSEKVTIKIANPEFINRFSTHDDITNKNNLRYFTIADKRMFRIQLTSENSEQAICNFGNAEISKEYCDQFNRIFADCRNYELA